VILNRVGDGLREMKDRIFFSRVLIMYLGTTNSVPVIFPCAALIFVGEYSRTRADVHVCLCVCVCVCVCE
jgi:hypothetical protein